MPDIVLKPEQKLVVAALAKGNSVLAILPTGFGKSLCYQYPALAWKWRVVVVAPLLALIEDQARRAEAMGLRVLAFHSLTASLERGRMERTLWSGEWDLLLLSPERLLQWIDGGRWDRLHKFVSLLVFDEVHCFIDWSSFRPAFVALEKHLPRIPRRIRLLALSATLPPESLQRLAMRWGRDFIGVRAGLGRNNLFLGVYPCESGEERTLRLFSLLRGLGPNASAIVYCGTRREADATASLFRGAGWRARAFHAGLSGAAKSDAIRALRGGGVQVVCATSAFGLGIDCANIERVIHLGPPPDLASYWQEAGRAGRSGTDAYAFLLWCRRDALRLRYFFDTSAAEEREWRERALRSLLDFLRTHGCRKRAVAAALGWEESDCGACDNCRRDLRFAWQTAHSRRRDPWWLDDKLQRLRGEWPELRLIRGS